MLKAAKSKWFERIFAVYNRNLLRRRFHSFRVRGLAGLANGSPAEPLIICANHSSWWDGLAAFELSRAAGLDAYVMMEEKQLKDLSLFRKLGAFSVVREDARRAYGSVKYAAGLLKADPGRTLWIFPQGEIAPYGRRPLGFYHGISKVIELAGPCRVACAAMRYEFFGDHKPEIAVKIGAASKASAEGRAAVKSLTAGLESSLQDEMDRLQDDLLSGDFREYREILR